jgi:hypothetical protein
MNGAGTFEGDLHSSLPIAERNDASGAEASCEFPHNPKPAPNGAWTGMATATITVTETILAGDLDKYNSVACSSRLGGACRTNAMYRFQAQAHFRT